MKRLFYFLTCLFLFCAAPMTWAATPIHDVRLAQYQTDVVRLVAETAEQPDFNVFKLSNPPRLVVDFPNAEFTQTATQKQGLSAAFINNLRLGNPTPQTCRFVLELPHTNIQESHFLIPPEKGGKWRFVMDLSNMGGAKTAPLAKSSPNTSSLSKTAAYTSSKSTSPRKKVIVLDPGHGGQDPGAISRTGKFEKDLTLKMGKELRNKLEKAGYRVVMTRDRDMAIPLRKRIDKAHQAKGDLFISIHADSALNTKAKGLSIYTISERASDKEAAALAERENKADIILGLDVGDYQPEVSNILIDLAKRDTMAKSSLYADLVVQEMKKKVKLVPNAHRFAGFVVLKSPNIPSVLLEMGYLSNKEEEKLLQKSAYRAKLAEALTKAVNTYFSNVNE